MGRSRDCGGGRCGLAIGRPTPRLQAPRAGTRGFEPKDYLSGAPRRTRGNMRRAREFAGRARGSMSCAHGFASRARGSMSRAPGSAPRPPGFPPRRCEKATPAQEEPVPVSSCTSFWRTGAAGRLSRMARRRLRARVNWAVRWGGIAVLALTAMLYVASSVRFFACELNGRNANVYVQLIRGRLGVNWKTAWGARPSFTAFNSFPVRDVREATPAWPEALLWEGSVRLGQPSWEAWMPLWWVGLGAGVLSVASWRAHRRAPRTLPSGTNGSTCPACNYNLSGLPPGSPCPECARPPDP